MPDRGLTIQRLETVKRVLVRRHMTEEAETIGDALELLKEQEPVKPIENAGFYYCGACKYAFTSGRQKFCSDCGRAVKWDAEKST